MRYVCSVCGYVYEEDICRRISNVRSVVLTRICSMHRYDFKLRGFSAEELRKVGQERNVPAFYTALKL